MVKLEYIYKKINENLKYTLFQYQRNESYFIYEEDTLIGSIIKFDGRWVQISGENLSELMILEMGSLIEFNALKYG